MEPRDLNYKKILIFKTIAESIATYGAEVWKVSKANRKKILPTHKIRQTAKCGKENTNGN